MQDAAGRFSEIVLRSGGAQLVHLPHRPARLTARAECGAVRLQEIAGDEATMRALPAGGWRQLPERLRARRWVDAARAAASLGGAVAEGSDFVPERLARFLGEIEYMKARWPAELARDPFFSPNFSDDQWPHYAAAPRVTPPWAVADEQP